MSKHACPECDRVHISEAEEKAQQIRAVARLRAMNAALLKGIQTYRRNATDEDLAGYLTGTLAEVAVFGCDDDGLTAAAVPPEPASPEAT